MNRILLAVCFAVLGLVLFRPAPSLPRVSTVPGEQGKTSPL